jgi:hypothetical protein
LHGLRAKTLAQCISVFRFPSFSPVDRNSRSNYSINPTGLTAVGLSQALYEASFARFAAFRARLASAFASAAAFFSARRPVFTVSGVIGPSLISGARLRVRTSKSASAGAVMVLIASAAISNPVFLPRISRPFV